MTVVIEPGDRPMEIVVEIRFISSEGVNITVVFLYCYYMVRSGCLQSPKLH